MLKIGGDCPELQLESPQQKMISLKRIYKLKRLITRFTTKFGGWFPKMTLFPKSHTLKSGQSPNPGSHLWMANRRKPSQEALAAAAPKMFLGEFAGSGWPRGMLAVETKNRRVGISIPLGKINEQKGWIKNSHTFLPWKSIHTPKKWNISRRHSCFSRWYLERFATEISWSDSLKCEASKGFEACGFSNLGSKSIFTGLVAWYFLGSLWWANWLSLRYPIAESSRFAGLHFQSHVAD